MSTEIYYFSGTGNSLHVAKELHKRIPETTLIPMASLLNKDVIETNGETVGFVFPIHLMTIPWNVKSVIKKLDVKSAKYIFAVVTRIGSPCSTAFTKIEKILKKKGKSLDSYLILNMASNDPKFKDWHSATEEEIANFECEIQNRLNSFQNIIMNKVTYREKDTQITLPVNIVMEHLGAFLAEISGDGGTNFYSDAKCTGCGICENVCLSQKIKMVDKKPVWQKNGKCFLCYACLNFCPVQSVQMRSGRFIKFYTDENGRYFHPEATANDIAGQK
ncbi:MAG: EFR1 family ferrodoxin [Eubacteriales bacterium]